MKMQRCTHLLSRRDLASLWLVVLCCSCCACRAANSAANPSLSCSTKQHAEPMHGLAQPLVNRAGRCIRVV